MVGGITSEMQIHRSLHIDDVTLIVDHGRYGGEPPKGICASCAAIIQNVDIGVRNAKCPECGETTLFAADELLMEMCP